MRLPRLAIRLPRLATRLPRLAALFLALSAGLVTWPGEIAAQAAPDGWNDDAALDLLRRVQAHRPASPEEGGLRSYAADATGFIYFLVDHPSSGREVLARTDQVAVEVHWAAPDRVHQRIVGLRQRKELPVNRLHYYLDRMTIVQDDHRGGIVIADGDNVDHVLHPAAPGGENFYAYRLADSTTLRLPGAGEAIRVLELQVRPLDPDQPAVIGSLFVESTTGAIVRMQFTFTRSAYRDRRLDYINVTLENALWEGSHWLPHEQRLEIRREMPELDFPVGTVIRTRLRIGNYRLDQATPTVFYPGMPVSMAPRAQREGYAFRDPIDAERQLEGIVRPPDVDALRREARQLVREKALGGLPRSRFWIPSTSELFRFNRHEGVVVGLGASFAPRIGPDLRLLAGYAFAADRPLARLVATVRNAEPRIEFSAFTGLPGEVGQAHAVSGAVNTLGALFAGADYTDPYLTHGATIALRHRFAPGRQLSLEARVEQQRSASLRAEPPLREQPFRAVGPIDEGTFAGGEILWREGWPAAGGAPTLELRLDAGVLRADSTDLAFLRPRIAFEAAWARRTLDSRIELRTQAGAAVGSVPLQHLFLAGGRGTLPGYDFRAFGGDRLLLADAVYSAALLHPWLRGRVTAAAGWTAATPSTAIRLDRWGAAPTDALLFSSGAGVGLFYDLLRLDLVRGWGPGGRWQLVIDAQRAFWDIL